MTQKFIITARGYLRLGYVDMHKDLLENGDECIGGGYYEIDPVGMRLLLSGHSYDFGAPHWEYLQWDEISLKVPKDYQGLWIVYIPDDRNENDMEVSRELKTEYF